MQSYFWYKPEVTLQGGGIGIGGGHIAGLHRHQLLMRLKVVIPGQHAGTDQLLLQDVDKVQQVLGLTATDVVYCIGRDGQAVFTRLLFGCFGHHTDNALDYIIDIGEVATAVAVVIDLDEIRKNLAYGNQFA